MRHGYSLKKLNRTSAHRQALLMNLAIALFKYEQIKTTLVKAKVLRPYAEKLITLARQDNLTNRRKLLALLSDEEVVQKLLDNVGPRFANRDGGYTRIYKVGFRYGDNAPMGLIELVLLDKEAMQNSRKNVAQKAKREIAEIKAQNESDVSESIQEKIGHDKAKSSKPRLTGKAPKAQKAISRKPTINKSLKGGG